MSKFLLRITLLIISLVVLFALFLPPSTADKAEAPLTSIGNSSSLEAAPLVSAQVMFTPVVTIYLPIVYSSFSPNDELHIDIQLPNGSVYQVGNDIRMMITVSSGQGVDKFVWAVFAKNLTPIMGAEKNCGGLSECSIDETFVIGGAGEYFLGVDALDVQSRTKTAALDFKVE